MSYSGVRGRALDSVWKSTNATIHGSLSLKENNSQSELLSHERRFAKILDVALPIMTSSWSGAVMKETGFAWMYGIS